VATAAVADKQRYKKKKKNRNRIITPTPFNGSEHQGRVYDLWKFNLTTIAVPGD